MAMILDAFMSKCSALLADYVQEQVIAVLGVKDELQKLQQKMVSIRSLLKDAERRKFQESSIDLWLSQLKDVMYDAEDIIDLCRIEGAQLLAADQNPSSEASPACCNFSCFAGVPLRHEVGGRIKKLNERLNRINENRKQFKLEKLGTPETPRIITPVDPRQTSSLVSGDAVGREVEAAANALVERLLAEKVEEKCRLFAVTGMGGIGKTALAQKIFNHANIQTYFKLKVWVCVSQTYLDTELLKQVIRGAKGNHENAATISELHPLLSNSVAAGKSLFLVLDDVWRADVWVDLLKAPLCGAKTSVRVLVTTRDENVADDMKPAHIHRVTKLSVDSGWDMLRSRLLSEGREELNDSLKEMGMQIVQKCGGLPLAIKAIAGVLDGKERDLIEWRKILTSDAWSVELPGEVKGALYLSFEDLPSHLKQCFLYLSLYPEDAKLARRDLTRLWVAEGFVTEQGGSLMEDLAKQSFNELVKRNLLLPDPSNLLGNTCKMHDLVRSLALFLSKEETSFGAMNVRNSNTSTKLRRISVAGEEEADKILGAVADQGALRTLLASKSGLLLNEENLRRLAHLRVLQMNKTKIQNLPNAIGNLVHLRYLDLDGTDIEVIPDSIEHLANLQFLNIRQCKNLTRLPSGITRLHNLRRLGLYNTPLKFIPKGIGELQKLNDLSGFVVSDDERASKLEELRSLEKIRKLSICKLERAQSGAIIFAELSNLTDLKLFFSENSSESNVEVEKLLDELMPPSTLKELKIVGFFGCRFPNWMALSTFESCVPVLTRLELVDITSCTQLPPLGQLPELKLLTISNVSEVKKIGPELLGGGVNSTRRIAFRKLELFNILDMPELEEWSFDAQAEHNASPRLKLFPCLKELNISNCPLLKQLPQGLKHSALKSLCIEKANSLTLVDDLPTETEVLQIAENENLEMVCCLPALKRLLVINCEALFCVEKLESLQELILVDYNNETLPEWLLMLLQERELQNDANDDFLLHLQCSEEALRECVEGGSQWELIQQIPRVIAYEDDLFGKGTGYLRYSKQPYVYDTNL